MKKALLIKPAWQSFHMGLAYVAAGLELAKVPFDLADFSSQKDFDLEGILREQDYVAVCAGGLLGDYTFFRDIFARVREATPHIPCILGGQITVDYPHHLLFSKLALDYLVVGEGEKTLPELLRHLNDNPGQPPATEGVVYRDANALQGFTKNKARRPMNLCEENILPQWNIYSKKHYDFGSPRVLTGRGCTGRCSFCSPTNGRFRARAQDFVFEELEYLAASYPVRQFSFINEVFYEDPEEVRVFCERYKARFPNVPWSCALRVDISPEVLPYMKQAGCTTINIGVESGSDRVLAENKKDITVEQIRAFVRRMKEEHITVQASFMVGNYGERAEDIANTVDLLQELEVVGPVALTINYPGTLNFIRAQKKGLVPDITAYAESLPNLFGNWYYDIISRHLDGTCTYLNLTEMPDAELFQVCERELRRYYKTMFRMKNVRVTEVQPLRYEVEGDCPLCGHRLVMPDIEPAAILLDMRKPCPRCGADECYVDPLDHPDYKAFYENTNIAQRLKKAKKIAIMGWNSQTRLFLMYGPLNFDFSKVAGFARHENWTRDHAMNYPILPLSTLMEQGVDTLVVMTLVQTKLYEEVGNILRAQAQPDYTGPRLEVISLNPASYLQKRQEKEEVFTPMGVQTT